jgi:hypothetical protein
MPDFAGDSTGLHEGRNKIDARRATIHRLRVAGFGFVVKKKFRCKTKAPADRVKGQAGAWSISACAL